MLIRNTFRNTMLIQMHLRLYILRASLFQVALVSILLGSNAVADQPSGSRVDCSTLTGKIMCGYQGWFNCPGDGQNRGWIHWCTRGGRSVFEAENVTVDLWPDVSELGQDERYETPLRHADGRVAEVFSSAHPKTVMRHFQWMEEYGIDGVFLQRFLVNRGVPDEKSHLNRVLDNVRTASQRHGRAYAMMYDLSGMKAGAIQSVKEDWTQLNARLDLTDDETYLHHEGKPVVAVWGIGFNDNRQYTLKECDDLITWLKSEGCTVMVGVPSFWRTGVRDATSNPMAKKIIAKADIVSPWSIGRYATPKQASKHADKVWGEDKRWCDDREMDFLPVVFPGFSWHNLNGDKLDAIPRLKGQFLWSQMKAAKAIGSEMIYVAMFDEVDEATAIFKCTNDPPVGDGFRFLDYEGLPSDFYLRLVGRSTAYLRGEINAEELSDLLGQ